MHSFIFPSFDKLYPRRNYAFDRRYIAGRQKKLARWHRFNYCVFTLINLESFIWYRFTVPNLFTAWFFKWYERSLDLFPLPDPFELLSETEWDRASSVTDVPDEYEDAAAVIWEYKIYNPLIILVLQLYFSRPEGCNKRQHPTPTSFARSQYSLITMLQQSSIKSSIMGCINKVVRWNSFLIMMITQLPQPIHWYHYLINWRSKEWLLEYQGSWKETGFNCYIYMWT